MPDNKDIHTSNELSDDYSLYKISSKCSTGACVGVAFLSDSVIVKNTSDEKQSLVTFTHEEWEAFIGGVKNKEFDIPHTAV